LIQINSIIGQSGHFSGEISVRTLNSSLIVLTLAVAPKHQAGNRGSRAQRPHRHRFRVTLVADSRGHFLIEPIVNGTRLRMLVSSRFGYSRCLFLSKLSHFEVAGGRLVLKQ
jgi:hypothetical protein